MTITAALKKKLLITALLIAALVVLLFLQPFGIRAVHSYNLYFYYPLQSLRIILFGWLPFSIGDVAYTGAGIAILFILTRWIRAIITSRRFMQWFPSAVLDVLCISITGYIAFMLGWGINYDKPPLAETWHLDMPSKKDTTALILFNTFLAGRLNELAPQYSTLSLKAVNDSSKVYYRKYTGSHVAAYGLDVKPSMFSWFIDRIGIDGYYNPFTGEGQVTGTLPAFMRPFIVCHEMAHQAGIAAEGDANLMSYAVCTAVPNATYNYSACLNIWLYTWYRLYRRDSASAKQLQASLNPLTRAHLDTLEELSKKYNNDAARYSTEVYDSYLKMQGQHGGIKTYGNVAASAWLLEQQRVKTGNKGLIIVP